MAMRTDDLSIHRGRGYVQGGQHLPELTKVLYDVLKQELFRLYYIQMETEQLYLDAQQFRLSSKWLSWSDHR